MNIVVVTPDYPYKRINSYPFVQQLVHEFARQGHSCVVIAPFNVMHNKQVCQEREVVEVAGRSVTIYRPNVLSFSNWKLFGVPLSYTIRKRRILHILNRLPQKPDVIYGHFWISGFLAYDYAKENQVPLFVATGESDVCDAFPYSSDRQPFYDYVRGVVAVSSKNKRESIDSGLTTEDKCQVFPNSIDGAKFHPMDRLKCREQLNLPQDAFILSFVGLFNKRKGAQRLSEAIRRIKGRPVYSLFIGEEGEDRPSCDHILYCGKVSHSQLATYLNASDAFVLPTLKEGCCNAIVEAMACGLPVISSDREFNDDILDEENSIRIDPMDVEAIASAIVRLRDDVALRQRMGKAALKRVDSLRIEDRSVNILNFIKSRI